MGLRATASRSPVPFKLGPTECVRFARQRPRTAMPIWRDGLPSLGVVRSACSVLAATGTFEQARRSGFSCVMGGHCVARRVVRRHRERSAPDCLSGGPSPVRKWRS